MIKAFNKKELLFVTALLLYPIISNPFPRSIGIPEILIGFLLVLSINYTEILPINYRLAKLKFRYLKVFQSIFFCILFFPSVIIIFNSDFMLSDYIRDLVPLLYMFIPYFYCPLLISKVNWKFLLPWLVAVIGSIQAIKFLLIIFKNNGIYPFLNIGTATYADDLLYLTYDSSVHFASTFLLMYAFVFILKKKYALSMITFLFGMCAFLSNFMIAQRGPTFLTMFLLAVFIPALLYQKLARKSVLQIVLFVSIISAFALYLLPEYNPISFNITNFNLLSSLLAKQEIYGLNEKDLEMQFVWDTISLTIPNFLFGIGWGSVFSNPVIRTTDVSFTHSALSYFLLKTGVLGLSVFICYLTFIFKPFLRLVLDQSCSLHSIVVFMSCISPIVVGLFLQVSYKSLSYGLVLLCLLMFYSNRTSVKA